MAFCFSLSLRLLGVLCVSAVSAAPPAEKIGEHRYRIGRVEVDTAAKTVWVPCRVNMRRGPIEYLAVAAEGKRHESVLLVEAEPLHVHLALLLVGLEPGTRPRFQGDPLWGRGQKATELAPSPPRPLASSPPRDGVVAEVVWQEASRRRVARLEELAWDIPARKPMAPVTWLFTGAADSGSGPRTAEDQSVVATYRDPGAVLNNPLPTGADDTVYKVNERLVPPVGTAVTLVLRPATPNHHGDTEVRRNTENG